MKLVLLAAALFAAAAHAASVPACADNQISVSLDSEDGNFNGMSHGGTLLVLRNIGPDACSVPGFPVLTFRDAAKAALPITREAPAHIHPGPVIVPAIIAPGAEVTASLRWVSGDVYDNGKCITPKTLSVTIGASEQTVAFGSQICGQVAQVTYSMTVLKPDPVYTPKP